MCLCVRGETFKDSEETVVSRFHVSNVCERSIGREGQYFLGELGVERVLVSLAQMMIRSLKTRPKEDTRTSRELQLTQTRRRKLGMPTKMTETMPTVQVSTVVCGIYVFSSFFLAWS